MTAVEYDKNVRILSGYVGNEPLQFLISEIEIAGKTAVVANQGFIQMIGFPVPPLRRRRLLGAMSTVIKERHVVRAGEGQMIQEAIDESLPGGLLIYQRLQKRDQASPFAAFGQQRFDGTYIVYAPIKNRHRRGILVDADQ